MVIILIFVMFIYVVCLHNPQCVFLWFYYAKKLIRGMFNLGVDMCAYDLG
jgi:hypothetical protein